MEACLIETQAAVTYHNQHSINNISSRHSRSGPQEAFEKADYGHNLMRQSILEPEDLNICKAYSKLHWLAPTPRKFKTRDTYHTWRARDQTAKPLKHHPRLVPIQRPQVHSTGGHRRSSHECPEHQALKQSYHPDLSDGDIQTYAQNENDYWPWRTQHMLTHDVNYKDLKRIPQPQFLTPQIFPWCINICLKSYD